MDEKLVCPECGSDQVTVTAEQSFIVNTGEHYCHSVKTHDPNAQDVARESVDDALMIVASYGPWGADLNDAHRRQIVLADEVHRLRHLYEMAVHGRAEMRAALRQLSDALRAALAEPAEQEAVAPQQQQQQQLKRTHPLDVPLEVFLADLTTRPANVIRLELTGLFDGEPLAVRHLCMFSRKEMKRWPNFGKKCLNEVEELLRARGLRLWESHDERSLRLLHEHKEYFL